MNQRMDLLLENSVYKTFNIWIFLARSPCLLTAKFLIQYFGLENLFNKFLILHRAGEYLSQSPQFSEKEISLER